MHRIAVLGAGYAGLPAVNRLTRVTRVAAGRLDTGRAFDLCLWAGGFTVPRLATDAGMKVDDRRRVITDATLRSLSDPDVYAIGDAGDPGKPVDRGATRWRWAAARVASRDRGRPTSSSRGCAACPPARSGSAKCLSLGRRHAVIQFLDRDGLPTDRTLRGRAATAYKNVVLDAAAG